MQLSDALDPIAENRLLAGWIRVLSRRPDQLNGPHEADSELVPLPGTDLLLALTVDTVAEEIALGFYRDAETIGWVAATVSLSDLAAVGADPLGLLVSVTLPRDAPAGFQSGIAAGLEEACRAAGTYVLGGDTNFGAQPSITSLGAGLVGRGEVLLRTGCRAGDLLYSTGPLGAGGPVAARALFELPGGFSPETFRPRARTREARCLAGFATACMDTSDGLIATLDQLSRLNRTGFELTTPLEDLLDPGALRLARALGTDPLLMLAQPHGEFELVFTVPEAEQKRFELHAADRRLGVLLLGRVIPDQIIRLAGPAPRVVDGARIRNYLDELDGDVPGYADRLMALARGA